MLTLLLGLWLVFFTQSTSVLEGSVRQGRTLDAVADVEISLTTSDSRVRFRATSDAQGRFVFENVPFGRYNVHATRAGYFTYPQGWELPGVVAFVTLDSQRAQQLTIDLIPGAVITGRITDPEGRPLEGVKVNASKLQYDEGRPGFNAGSVPVTTNDQGEYRMFWLSPGEYYVRAEYTGPRSNLSRKSYYPGTLDSRIAATLNVRGGESFDGISFAIPSGSSIHISGQVVHDREGPASGSVRTFYLLPRDGRPAEIYPLEFTNTVSTQNSQSTSDFALDIRGVEPGTYDLAPFYIDRTGFYHSGRTRVEVGTESIENLSVVVSPNTDVAGRFVLEGGTPFRNWSALGLQLRAKEPAIPLMSRSGLAMIAADGTFVIRQVPEAEYQIYLGASLGSIPSDLYISGIRQGGLDIRNEGIVDVRPSMNPIEVTLGFGAGTVRGIVEAPGGVTPKRADVVLVPQISRRGNVMFYDRTTVDDKGQFTFEGVAPGEYKVFAFEQLLDTAERNPAFIAHYETLGQPVVVSSRSTTEIRTRLLQ